MILGMQGTRRGWSCWDPRHAGATQVVLLRSLTCRKHMHVGGGPVGILHMQGPRREWSCWDPKHAHWTKFWIYMGVNVMQIKWQIFSTLFTHVFTPYANV